VRAIAAACPRTVQVLVTGGRRGGAEHPSIRHRGRAARDHVGGDHHGSSSVDRSGRNRVRQLRGRTFIKSERQ